MDESMTRVEFLMILYSLQELMESGNIEGAKKVIDKAVKQAELSKRE